MLSQGATNEKPEWVFQAQSVEAFTNLEHLFDSINRMNLNSQSMSPKSTLAVKLLEKAIRLKANGRAYDFVREQGEY